jgi:hypothetical protein
MRMVHAETSGPIDASGGFQSISIAFYPAQNETNGNIVYEDVVTVNWVGALNGLSRSYEKDMVCPNGTATDLGTGTFIGSIDGGPPGSMIDNYKGSFNGSHGILNATQNDVETFSAGEYGLTGLQIQVTEQAHPTSCNSQQTLLGLETVCTGTGKYVLVATP